MCTALSPAFQLLAGGCPWARRALHLRASVLIWIALGSRVWSYPISTCALPFTCSGSISQGDHLSDLLLEAWRSTVLLGILEISDEGQDGA